MSYQVKQQDIFFANSGVLATHHCTLTVNPGSPVSFRPSVASTSNQDVTATGISVGNGLYISYGAYSRTLQTYPAVSGTAATALGQAGVNAAAISGQYHIAGNTRYDDVRYYVTPTGQQGNPNPN